jgi:hypothetical protein
MTKECPDNQFIDIIGLCDLDAIDFRKYPFWTQISIPEELIIPEQKPDLEQINSVSVGVEILRTKVIVTPTSSSRNHEGKFLTGRKLIIEGGVYQTVNYTALVASQSVHTAHFMVPFSAYIVIPKEIRIDTQNIDTLNLNFQVNACVEDVFIKDFGPRGIFKNVTLLLQAVPVSSVSCNEDC